MQIIFRPVYFCFVYARVPCEPCECKAHINYCSLHVAAYVLQACTEPVKHMKHMKHSSMRFVLAGSQGTRAHKTKVDKSEYNLHDRLLAVVCRLNIILYYVNVFIVVYDNAFYIIIIFINHITCIVVHNVILWHFYISIYQYLVA